MTEELVSRLAHHLLGNQERKNQFKLIPMASCKGPLYLILSSGMKYLDNIEELELKLINEFSSKYCRVEDINKYIGKEWTGSSFQRFISNTRAFALYEAQVDLLDFYMNHRLNLIWRSEKFNNNKKRRKIIHSISEVKQTVG